MKPHPLPLSPHRFETSLFRPPAGVNVGVDLLRPRLTPDVCAPGSDIADVLDLVDHLAGRQQLAVVVAAVDTRGELVDTSPDINSDRA